MIGTFTLAADAGQTLAQSQQDTMRMPYFVQRPKRYRVNEQFALSMAQALLAEGHVAPNSPDLLAGLVDACHWGGERQSS